MTQYSIVNQVYSDNRTVYLSYLEASSAMGMILGPPLGSIVFGLFGYQWSFYVFSILLFVNLINCICFIPSKLNIKNEDIED